MPGALLVAALHVCDVALEQLAPELEFELLEVDSVVGVWDEAREERDAMAFSLGALIPLSPNDLQVRRPDVRHSDRAEQASTRRRLWRRTELRRHTTTVEIANGCHLSLASGPALAALRSASVAGRMSAAVRGAGVAS